MRDRSTIGQRVTGRHRFLCRMAGELEGDSILDVGCGFGWFERYAIESGCARIVGLDINPELIEMSRNSVPGAEYLLLDITTVTPQIGKFSVVCVFDLVEHLPRGQDVLLLRRLSGLLEDGGRLLLSVPYLSFLSAALDPAFYFGHRHFSIHGMDDLLARGGFRACRIAYAGGVWEQLSMIWLYIFKWIFRGEMPFYDLFESKRSAEYEGYRPLPSIAASATMFVEAVPETTA